MLPGEAHGIPRIQEEHCCYHFQAPATSRGLPGGGGRVYCAIPGAHLTNKRQTLKSQMLGYERSALQKSSHTTSGVTS